METAVSLQYLSRRIVHITGTASPHETGDILRQAKTGDREQTAIDQFLIFIGYFSRHVSLDDPRTDLKDRYTIFCQPVREQGRDHGDPCFGDAVFSAVGGRSISGHRADVDDARFIILLGSL